MLDNFKEIYDNELKEYCGGLDSIRFILSSREVRMFVYAVCKGCVASQPTVEADAGRLCDYCDDTGEIATPEGPKLCPHCHKIY